MKSRSSSTARLGPRAGFTLLEMTIAGGIGMLIGGLVLYAYLGADKAQSLSVSSNMMKLSGQSSLAAIYGDINRARRIFDRSQAWLLARMPIDGFAGGLSPGVPTTGNHVILPQIRAAGSFARFQKDGGGNQGAADPNFSRPSVGNALFFMTEEAPIEVGDGTTTFHTEAFGHEKYRFTTYRFHFLFLARRPLPTKAPRVRSDATWVPQLMYFTSGTYLNETEVEGWMQALKARTTSPDTFIATKLTAMRTATGAAALAGAVDLSATTAGGFFRRLQATTIPNLDADSSANFDDHKYRAAIKFDMRSSFGESFVAFNTIAPTSGTPPAVPLRSLGTPYAVPSFADPNTGYPYGFETMVIGPPLGRQVLLHLTLCTRTQPGGLLLGEAFQQIAACQEF